MPGWFEARPPGVDDGAGGGPVAGSTRGGRPGSAGSTGHDGLLAFAGSLTSGAGAGLSLGEEPQRDDAALSMAALESLASTGRLPLALPQQMHRATASAASAASGAAGAAHSAAAAQLRAALSHELMQLSSAYADSTVSSQVALLAGRHSRGGAVVSALAGELPSVGGPQTGAGTRRGRQQQQQQGAEVGSLGPPGSVVPLQQLEALAAAQQQAGLLSQGAGAGGFGGRPGRGLPPPPAHTWDPGLDFRRLDRGDGGGVGSAGSAGAGGRHEPYSSTAGCPDKVAQGALEADGEDNTRRRRGAVQAESNAGFAPLALQHDGDVPPAGSSPADRGDSSNSSGAGLVLGGPAGGSGGAEVSSRCGGGRRR
ncbi:hypothetical protein GPECTOR_2g1375 [Gonium pectorale]|uniref:Uncharacterized protein n=1 Tax=Gonium pectorale TaxID=33097 RepID=A0A150H1A3_GONPE|nr:hypothetical protein GPECTOR_2g1375 [Gonium pectorale]|eukprot:KXZ55824.1 hypothetical protein GPECTOR_2g1375 [Gonium pectorale]